MSIGDCNQSYKGVFEYMKIAILGVGNVGCATACDLASRGHDVTLIKTSTSRNDENYCFIKAHNNQIILNDLDGKVVSAQISNLTRDISCVSNSELILVMTQTTYHESIIKRIVPYLHKNQIILFNPGYFATAYMLKYKAPNGVIIAEAESSFIDCRLQEYGRINVSFRNVRNPIGVYPTSKVQIVQSVFEKLGFPFSYLSSVIEAALHNPNLIVHTVGAIMSIPRVEKTQGDYYMYHEVFTPSVWKLLEKLDEEKMNVLSALGFERIPYVEACKFRNSLDDSKDAKEVFFEYANDPNSVKGPTSVDARYITEDVPQGLVLLETLGDHLGVMTTISTSLINIASAALGYDLRLNGRTINNLGMENINRVLADAGHNGI